MEKYKVVYIWKLSEGDIKDVCEKNEVDYDKLTKKNKQDIVYYFGKGFEAIADAWEDILRDAISEVL